MNSEKRKVCAERLNNTSSHASTAQTSKQAISDSYLKNDEIGPITSFKTLKLQMIEILLPEKRVVADREWRVLEFYDGRLKNQIICSRVAKKKADNLAHKPLLQLRKSQWPGVNKKQNSRRKCQNTRISLHWGGFRLQWIWFNYGEDPNWSAQEDGGGGSSWQDVYWELKQFDHGPLLLIVLT